MSVLNLSMNRILLYLWPPTDWKTNRPIKMSGPQIQFPLGVSNDCVRVTMIRCSPSMLQSPTQLSLHAAHVWVCAFCLQQSAELYHLLVKTYRILTWNPNCTVILFREMLSTSLNMLQIWSVLICVSMVSFQTPGCWSEETEERRITHQHSASWGSAERLKEARHWQQRGKRINFSSIKYKLAYFWCRESWHKRWDGKLSFFVYPHCKSATSITDECLLETCRGLVLGHIPGGNKLT